MSDSAKKATRRLVEAFGRPDDVVAVLAEDATWWITPSTPPEIMRSQSHGREEIHGNMQRVFTMLYDGPSVRVHIHDMIGEDDLTAVRFTLTAQFPPGGSYSNEYTIWTRVREGQVTHVWEYVDAAHAMSQMQAAGIDVSPADSTE